MEALSVRDYRNNLSASFSKAESGKTVLIRRKNQIYALVKVGREDLVLTPELQAQIEEVEKACAEGRCVSLASHEEIDNFFNSL